MNGFVEDVRFALRGLLRGRRFTATAALTLALVVGTNAAIFSLSHAVLRQPIEVTEIDRLVLVDLAGRDQRELGVPVGTFLDWKRESQSFVNLSGYDLSLALLGEGGGPRERVVGADVSPDFFEVLGGTVALGRTFEAREVEGDRENVVVLSDALWKRRFGGDPGAVGKPLLIGGTPFTVIGVMAAGFAFPVQVELWYPVHHGAARLDRAGASTRVFGRLVPGATLHSAEEELGALHARLQKLHPEMDPRGQPRLEPLRHLDLTGVGTVMETVLGASYFLLFIGCANLATQLLARSLGRRKEIATRLSLGASRARIVRQLLTESVLLGLLGALLGVLVAHWLINLSKYLFSSLDFLPGFRRAGLDVPTFLYLAAVGVATGVLFGLVPALQLARTDDSEVLKEAGRSYTGTRRTRLWRDGLIVAQVALALLVACGGVTFASLLDRVMRHKGFDVRAVTAASLQLAPEGHDTVAATAQLADRMLAELHALPTVRGAALVSPEPYARQAHREPLVIEGLDLTSLPPPRAYRHLATAELPAVLSLRVLRGRFLTDADRDPTRPVAVVSGSFVDAYLAHAEPLGRRLSFGESPDGKTRWPTIVGVVDDIEETPGQGREPTVYLALPQWHFDTVTVLARSSDGADLSTALEPLLQPLPGVFVVRKGPFHDFVADRLIGFRLLANLTVVFAAMALLIAAVGLNGATTFLVAERTNELGVRAAIGATPAPLLGLVMRKGVVLTALGLVLGLAASVPTARYTERILYAFGALDPRVIALGATAVLVVTVVGSLIPGLRASRLEPQIALQRE